MARVVEESLGSRVIRAVPAGLLLLVALTAWGSVRLAGHDGADASIPHEVVAVDAGWISWDESGSGTVVTHGIDRAYSTQLQLSDPDSTMRIEYRVDAQLRDDTRIRFNGASMDSAEELGEALGGTPGGSRPIGWPVAYRYEFKFDGRDLTVDAVECWEYVLVLDEFDYLDDAGVWTLASLSGTFSPRPDPERETTRADVESRASSARAQAPATPSSPVVMTGGGQGYVFAHAVLPRQSRYDAVLSPPGGYIGLVGSGSLQGLCYQALVDVWVDEYSLLVLESGTVNLIDYLDQQADPMWIENEYLCPVTEIDGDLVLDAIIQE